MHQQMPFQVIFYLTTSLIETSYIYWVTLPERPPEDDCRRAFLATIRKPRSDGKDHKNAVEQPGPGAWRTNDLAQRNIGLHSDVRQAKDGSCWRVATVTLLHEICQ